MKKSPAAVAHEMDMAPTTLMNRLKGFTYTKSTELDRMISAFGFSSKEELLVQYPKIRMKPGDPVVTQRQAATNMGIGFPLLNAWLTGHTRVSDEDLDEMATTFGFSSKEELLVKYPKIRMKPKEGQVKTIELATKLGVRTPTVRSWLSGKYGVPPQYLDGLIAALGLSSVEELLEQYPKVTLSRGITRDTTETARQWSEMIGKKPEYLRQVLSGYHPLTKEISDRLCAALNCTEEELFTKYPKLRKLSLKKQRGTLQYARQYAEVVEMSTQNLYQRLQGRVRMKQEDATRVATAFGYETVEELTKHFPLIRITERAGRGPGRPRVPFTDEDTTQQTLTISVAVPTVTIQMNQRQTDQLVAHLKAVREMTGVTFDLTIKMTV